MIFGSQYERSRSTEKQIKTENIKADPNPDYICTYVGKVYVEEVYYVGKSRIVNKIKNSRILK